MDEKLQALVSGFQNEQDRAFIIEALHLQDEAERAQIPLRLLGSLAFRLQCPQNSSHFETLERRITDIDFAGLTRDRDRLMAFFKAQGYEIDENALLLGGGYRYIFENPATHSHLDIFFDHLEMCHTIVFKDRLTIDERTLSLADLLLEKMQIVEISRKDFKDTAVLLLEHQVGDSDQVINLDYIGGIMSGDWGFYHTFTTNLKKLGEVASGYETFSELEKDTVRERIKEILDRVVGVPKNIKWKARAKIGTKVRWYKQVD